MAHVKEITNADFVEVATLTNALSRREISELRVIAAELNREKLEPSAEHPPRKTYNHVIRRMLDENRITLEQINSINGIDGVDDGGEIFKQTSEQTLERIVLTLVNHATFASKQRRSSD